MVAEQFSSNLHVMMGGVEWQPFTHAGSHLGLLMAHNFVITPCAAVMENRPPDLRRVRVVHSFTGRVVLEATHPRIMASAGLPCQTVDLGCDKEIAT